MHPRHENCSENPRVELNIIKLPVIAFILRPETESVDLGRSEPMGVTEIDSAPAGPFGMGAARCEGRVAG